jgi:CRISPR type III-A-associated protein Csm2
MPDDLLKTNQIEISDFFENNQLKQSLINDVGQGNIKQLIELLREKIEGPRDNRGKTKKLNDEIKINQLRKFYDNFLRIHHAKISENEKKVQLLMLKSNAEYSANRLTIKRFEIFLSNRINIVLKKNGDDFERYLDAFKLHFEALVGYFPKNQ